VDRIEIKTTLIALEETRESELVVRHLAQLGVKPILRVASGQEAWQKLMTRKVDLLIIGWGLREVSGLALLNRFRQLPGYELTPVMVVSQRVSAEDFSLLQELACIKHLLKTPLTRVNFEAAFNDLLDDATWYARNTNLIENLLEFAEKDGAKALSLLRTPLVKAPNPIPLALLMARKLRESGYAAEAMGLLGDILKKDPGSVPALSETGKSHFLKGDHVEASRFLEQAQVLSPKNVARLCLLGEIDLVQDKQSVAMMRFTKALEIDPKEPTSSAAVQLIASGQGNRIKELSGGSDVTRSLASMLNMNAIGLVRSGRYGEGLEAYFAALNLITQNPVRARVAYNVGLAFLRWGKLEKALEWFQHAADIADPSFGKAATYVTLVEGKLKAVKEGIVLVDDQGVEILTSDVATVASVPIDPEDFEEERIYVG
jgi:tetratricopeptide (TPR) repeat protein